MRTTWTLKGVVFGGFLASSNLAMLTLPNSACAQLTESSVEELIEHLAEEDVNVRRDAAYELVRRRAASTETVLALAESVSDNDKQVRFQALLGLARLGVTAEPAIPQLIDLLRDRDDQIRYRAADALGKIGAPALQPLMDAWEKASADAKIAMAQSLALIGPDASPARDLLVESLAESSNALPRYAAEALVAIAPSDETTVLKLVTSELVAVRSVGIASLASLPTLSDAATEALRQATRDEESTIRETAIIALAKSNLPRVDKELLIEAALTDSSAAVRAAALGAMRKAELLDDAFATRIAERLKSTEPTAVEDLIKAIAVIGPDARGTLPRLVEILPAPSLDENQISLAIASFGEPVVAELLTAIQARPEIEPTLSRALALIGHPAVEALISGMSSENELVRLAATRAIGGIQPLDEMLVERLAVACGDSSPTIRIVAATSLIGASAQSESSRAALLAAMRDPDAEVRAASLVALSKVEFSQDEIDAVLDAALVDSSPVVRTSALAVAAEQPTQLNQHIAKVTHAIADSDPTVRRQAAQTVGKYDKKKVDASIIEALGLALGDQDHTVRIAATEAVHQLAITDDTIQAAVAANLIDDFELLRVSLEAMASFGNKADALLPTIVNLLKHERADVRVAAITALTAIDADKERLASQLTVLLEDSEWSVRRLSGEQLGKLGPVAKGAVPKLFSLLRNDEDTDFANNALREIDAAPVEAIPMLIENIDSRERRVAFYAVSLLGKIGPPAAEALPKLEEMLNSERDRSDFRKRFLREAIAAIKGEEIESRR